MPAIDLSTLTTGGALTIMDAIPPATPPPPTTTATATATTTTTTTATTTTTTLREKYQSDQREHHLTSEDQDGDGDGDENGNENENGNGNGNENETPRRRRQPPISRDRCDELRLSEQQQELLSLIIKTIKEGNYDKFLELLRRKRDSKRNILNVHVDGQTALHYSLIYGRDLAWCKQLVMNGANPNLTNRAGWHPIHLAAYSCKPDTLLYLLEPQL